MALGAQYFAGNLPHGYEARYGILLDMVGGQGAQFYQEGMSKQYAPEIQKKVWRAPRQAGYGSYFQQRWWHDYRRPHPCESEGQHPHYRYHPVLSRLSAEFLRTHLAHPSDDMAHRPADVEGCGQTVIQVLYTEK